MRKGVTRRLAALTIAAAALLSACSAGATPRLPQGSPPRTQPAPALPTPPPPATCNPNKPRSVVASYAPSGALPAATALPSGSTMARIRARGRLIAGVSADNLQFGFRNPLNNQIEGFDVDMIRAVARAIFGNVPGIDSKIEFRVVNFAQRIPELLADSVDIVADVMTITCQRWGQIAFSSEYFDASQQVLVADTSKAKSIDDLDGHKVCAATGSSGSQSLATYKKIKPVVVGNISECMVLFQQGTVDGIISDNTVLAGFASQDPYAKVLKQRLDDEPYGMGINKKDVDLVRFVNAVIQRMRTDGEWARLYAKWVAPTLGPVSGPPPAVYGR